MSAESNSNEEKAVAAMVAAMRPQVDEAIAQFARSFMSAIEATSEVEVEQCISIVEACGMTTPSPLGPLHASGWNEAIAYVAGRLRAWKAESKRPISAEDLAGLNRGTT